MCKHLQNMPPLKWWEKLGCAFVLIVILIGLICGILHDLVGLKWVPW